MLDRTQAKSALPPTPPRPARVVFLLQDLEFGGTQRQIIELAPRLDPTRFHAEVWLLIARDDMVPLARAKGLRPRWISRHSYVWPLIDQIKLWRKLHEKPIDLLMLLTGVPNIWGRILGHLPRIPLIVGNCRGESDFRLQFERWLWPLADHFICNASALKDGLMRNFPIAPHCITVIPNGVDTDFFRPPATRTPHNPPRVLSLARMVPDKDHETLVRAFRLVLASHPRAELWLAGNGHRHRIIKRLVSQTLPVDQVKFLPGKIDPRSLLHQTDLLVLNSIREGMPNVVLEAMAAGLPVVATRVGGLAELVVSGKNGWLVPPRDVPALAAAITQVLGCPETLRQFGQAGRRLVERHFAIDVMVSRYQELFERLLAQSN